MTTESWVSDLSNVTKRTHGVHEVHMKQPEITCAALRMLSNCQHFPQCWMHIPPCMTFVLVKTTQFYENTYLYSTQSSRAVHSLSFIPFRALTIIALLYSYKKQTSMLHSSSLGTLVSFSLGSCRILSARHVIILFHCHITWMTTSVTILCLQGTCNCSCSNAFYPIL